MTNIILLVLTSLAGFFFGKQFEKRLKRRENLYNDLRAFSVKMRSNVNFENQVLDKFVEEFEKSASTEFSEAVKTCVKNEKSDLPVSRQEAEYLVRFFDGLCSYGSEECVKHLDYYVEYFADKANAVREEFSAKGKLGLKVGTLLGLIVGLIFI